MGRTMNTWVKTNQVTNFINKQLSFSSTLSALIGEKSFEMEEVVNREVRVFSWTAWRLPYFRFAYEG